MKKSEGSCFNIYYLNFSKVYEISMMINNVVLSSIQREKSSMYERLGKLSSSLTGSIGSKEYLAEIKSVIGSEVSQKNVHSSKMIESLDVKTTKSILLRRIVEKCKPFKDFNSIHEGDLIKLDKIKLKILNEENLRQILMLRKDALKGFRVDGMEINNLISSILQDYSYILYGCLDNGDEIVIKIPLEIENEFESKYNVDDLLIGHVSVIGVYKGGVTESFITTNTFNYLTAIGSQQSEQEKKVFPSSKPEVLIQIAGSDRRKTYQFIDVIAIIQDVFFQQPSEAIKLSWFKQLKCWFARRKISE